MNGHLSGRSDFLCQPRIDKNTPDREISTMRTSPKLFFLAMCILCVLAF